MYKHIFILLSSALLMLFSVSEAQAAETTGLLRTAFQLMKFSPSCQSPDSRARAQELEDQAVRLVRKNLSLVNKLLLITTPDTLAGSAEDWDALERSNQAVRTLIEQTLEARRKIWAQADEDGIVYAKRYR